MPRTRADSYHPVRRCTGRSGKWWLRWSVACFGTSVGITAQGRTVENLVATFAFNHSRFHDGAPFVRAPWCRCGRRHCFGPGRSRGGRPGDNRCWCLGRGDHRRLCTGRLGHAQHLLLGSGRAGRTLQGRYVAVAGRAAVHHAGFGQCRAGQQRQGQPDQSVHAYSVQAAMPGCAQRWQSRDRRASMPRCSLLMAVRSLCSALL